MKRRLTRILVILIVLAVFIGSGLLIKLGLYTFISVKNDTAADDLRKELSIVSENINNKISELKITKDTKKVECDKLEAIATNTFFKGPNSEEYYASERNWKSCQEEVNDIDTNIFALEKKISYFAKTDDVRQLIETRENIQEKIDNPIKTISWHKVLGIVEIIGGILIILIQISNIINIYNKIIKSFNMVKNNFANIDVYLKKRWDLIPNIIEIVKEYSKHESKTLEVIAKLRKTNYSNMNLNEKVSLNNDVSSAISKIMALKEDYPELKANENFLDLSKKLSMIEDDIANSRISYNNSVMYYNNTVKMFPNNIFATFFKYDEIEMFRISDNEKNSVEVKF